MRSIDTQHEGAGLLLAEDDFATESIEFLETNSELKKEMAFTWGVGSDEVAIFECLSPEAADEKIAAVKAWRALKFDAGFGWITGPTQFGGRGLPASFERIFVSLEALYDVPDQISTLGIGLGMVAPTILAHGTHLVKEQYLRALYRADIIGCQLFSEPSAGSDLAGVTTRAIRHGNEWVLNGQKVWTSGAHFSDIGEILCRTNADAPKHQGLTAFLLDMHAPGVEVRPLRQMTGGASFNEVFLTDVRVPDSYRLGEVDGGWGVAITTLMNERATIVSDNSDNGLGLADGERLIAMVQHLGLNKDPLIRQQLAKLYIDF